MTDNYLSNFDLDRQRDLIPRTLYDLATQRIAQSLAVPPEYFHLPPESSSASAARQAREEFSRKLRTYQIEWVYLTAQELFLLEARRKFSPKIYHNIQRRITRQTRRAHWLYAPRIYAAGLRISRDLEDKVFRDAYPGESRRLAYGGDLGYTV